jgi:hypothetical protein
MAQNRLIIKGLAWLMCCALSGSAWAGRPVKVYEVDLKGPQSPAALQDAMREALVRTTGRRESAADPALASLISDAQNYVKGYSPPVRGQSQVIFDGVAVERAIVAAGRSVWDRNRPFTLVVLYPPVARTAEDAVRTEVEQTAIARGLPVTLVPLSPVDSSGNDLSREAILQMAQRYGGDAVLVGRGDAGAANAQVQWTLHTSFSSGSWKGSLAAGVDGAVDFMAPAQGGSLAQIESVARVEITGVTTLADYASVERILESIPGVRRANVGAASGNVAVFEVMVRGGGDAMSHALTDSSHLVQSAGSSARLSYEYRP